VADGVHAGVDPMQTPRGHPVRDASIAHAELAELRAVDHPVLLASTRCNSPVDGGVMLILSA
jgi:hypothetical protein